MRQIVLDTETTGLKPEDGHRIIEIGCIELYKRRITGKNLHLYINPKRKIEAGALEVHGITEEFLNDKPPFGEIVDIFLDFIGQDELIIHNAAFDLGFLNHELRLHHARILTLQKHCPIIDTLTMARKMFPGQRNSLDALCKRFQIDNSHREWHGALLDAELLAKVYLAMTSGQTHIFNADQPLLDENVVTDHDMMSKTLNAALPIIKANSEELTEHEKYLELLQKKAGTHYWNLDSK